MGNPGYIGIADARGKRIWEQNDARFQDDVRNRETVSALFRLRERLIELQIANP